VTLPLSFFLIGTLEMMPPTRQYITQKDFPSIGQLDVDLLGCTSQLIEGRDDFCFIHLLSLAISDI
jgi:hypothetical protein